MCFGRGLTTILAVTGGIAVAALFSHQAAAQITPFQGYRNQNCTASECTLNFAVPAGERRELNTVSCLATINPNNAAIKIAYVAAFNQTGTLLGAHFLVPSLNGTATTVSYNTMNNQLFLFAPAGGKFQIVVGANGATEVDIACGISGQRIK